MDHRVSKSHSSRQHRSRSTLLSSSTAQPGRPPRPRATATTTTTRSASFQQALLAAATAAVESPTSSQPVAQQTSRQPTEDTVVTASHSPTTLLAHPISSLPGLSPYHFASQEPTPQLTISQPDSRSMSTLLYSLPAPFDFDPYASDFASNTYAMDYPSGQQSHSYTPSSSSSGYISYTASPALPVHSPVAPSNYQSSYYAPQQHGSPQGSYSPYTPSTSVGSVASPPAQTSYLNPPTGLGVYPPIQTNSYSSSQNYSLGYTSPHSAYGSSASASYSYPPSVATASHHLDESVRVLNPRPKPQCWEHGCNGRQFSTFSNLLRHQREKSGAASKSYCPKCGAEFTRTTAMKGHMAQDKCKRRSTSEGDHA